MGTVDDGPLVPPAAGVPAASVATALLEAVRAIHRLVAARLERHLGFLAATRTGGAEHLARRPASTVGGPVATERPALPLGLAGGATVRAAARLAEAAAGIEILLAAGG